jgi:hypothetical protein
MKIRIVSCSIAIEVLSADAIPGLLYEIAEKMKPEVTEGYLRKDDGDEITWKVVIGEEKEVT